jgi:copper homeostasis protein
MMEDIKITKEYNANGVVLGILKSDGTIDIDRMKKLIEAAKPLSITFHRAFDMTIDPFEALKSLIELGVGRILTSGQATSAYEGRGLIKKLIEKANGRLSIMPGGGINHSNAKAIIDECNVTEIHSSASEKISSKMIYRNEATSMGKKGSLSEYESRATSADKVRLLINAIK